MARTAVTADRKEMNYTNFDGATGSNCYLGRNN